jgi:hypothetical protein
LGTASPMRVPEPAAAIMAAAESSTKTEELKKPYIEQYIVMAS